MSISKYINNKIKITKIDQTTIFFALTLIIFLIVAFCLYFAIKEYPDLNSLFPTTRINDLALWGDFVGGAIGSLISAITVAAVLYSIHIQQTELRNTIRSFNEQVKETANQNKILINQNNSNIISKLISKCRVNIKITDHLNKTTEFEETGISAMINSLRFIETNLYLTANCRNYFFEDQYNTKKINKSDYHTKEINNADHASDCVVALNMLTAFPSIKINKYMTETQLEYICTSICLSDEISVNDVKNINDEIKSNIKKNIGVILNKKYTTNIVTGMIKSHDLCKKINQERKNELQSSRNHNTNKNIFRFTNQIESLNKYIDACILRLDKLLVFSETTESSINEINEIKDNRVLTSFSVHVDEKNELN